MQIYENKKIFLRKKRVQIPQDLFAEHQYGRRFGRRDVIWKRSILSG